MSTRVGRNRNGKIILLPYSRLHRLIAKKTSKNQLTLPKKVVDRFPDVQYFDMRVDDAQITLVPVRPGQLQQVHARLQQLGISERDVRDAVAWARRSGRRRRG